MNGLGAQTPQDKQPSASAVASRRQQDDLPVKAISVSPNVMHRWESPLGKPKLDTPIRIHSLCGLHIEIGDRYLPCSSFREHSERLPDNGIVLDLAPMRITEDQIRG